MQPEYRIVAANEQRVRSFLQKLTVGALQFRYFRERPIAIIKNHLITALVIDRAKSPVAYGHLEKEDNVLWLGIAVADDHVNRGLGKLLMKYLINHAKNKHEPLIQLSVDKENFIAQGLYKKFGFIKREEFAGYYIFELKLI